MMEKVNVNNRTCRIQNMNKGSKRFIYAQNLMVCLLIIFICIDEIPDIFKVERNLAYPATKVTRMAFFTFCHCLRVKGRFPW